MLSFNEFCVLNEAISKQIWVKAMQSTEKEAEEMVGREWAKFTPEVCNSGFCDIFADFITKNLPGSETYDTEWTDCVNKTHGHVWFKYNGKFYDAEIPNGVEDIKDIPYIKRVIKCHGSIPYDIKVVK
jgi:hypothetical protein